MNNSLNFIRYIAAVIVFYSHSFTLYGLKAPLFLTVTLGKISVMVFFIISGYLISKSWDRTPNIFIFLKKRVLRIFPALFICIIITTFILGLLVTNLSLYEYLINNNTYKYLLNIALYIIYYLPGVFEHLPYKNVVNGSLWTLPIEFFLYIFIMIIGILHLKKNIYIVIYFLFFLFFLLINKPIIIYATDIRAIFLYGLFFIAGVLFNKFNLEKLLTFKNFLLSIVILSIINIEAQNIKHLWLIISFLLSIVILFFGLKIKLNKLSFFHKNDISYGLYIYSFPIQQTILYYYPNISFLYYIILSFFIINIIAYLSWHFIEKPMLRLKNF